MKCKAIFLMLIVLCPAMAQASIAIITDILKVQTAALSTTSNRTANQLAGNLNSEIVNLYVILDADGTLNYDESNPDMLLETVDIIYNDEIFQKRSGLTTALNGISNLADDAIFINDAYSAASAIVSSLKAFRKVTQQVSSIFKLGDTAEKLRLRSHILNNLLEYGSGNNNTYLTLKNNVNDYLILSNQVDQFSEFVQYLAAIGEAGANSDKAYKAIDALIAALKPHVAATSLTNLKNGEWSKLVIQDFVIDQWRKKGKDFSEMKAYTRDGDACLGFFDFSACKVKTDTTANIYAPDNNSYSETYYDFEVIVTRSVLADKANTFVIELPDNIVNHPTLGNPVSVSYRADGIDILTSYPSFVSGEFPISDTTAIQAFVFDLNAVKQLSILDVSVQYSTGLPLLAQDFLRFIPQLTELSLVDLPAAPSTDSFTIGIRVCGDPINYVKLRYKNTDQTAWQEESIQLIDGAAQEANCKKYTIDIDGWDINRYTSSNRDIQFSLKAVDLSSATEAFYLINSSDTDNDGMRDSCERLYFADLSKQPEDDEDADGLSNKQECELGSNPIIAGVAGITAVVNIEPLQLSNGTTINDCALNESYWANVNIRCTTTLYRDAVIVGGVNLQNYTLDLNGYSLTIKGNLIHSGGVLNINNGSLIVKGDYRSQTVSTDESGNATYSYSTGRLDMRTANDYMLVEGDFIIDYHTSHNGLLTAGVLELKGNFEQRATNSGSISDNSNFATSGTHKVLLSGSSLQTVTFQTPGSSTSLSHFNVLEITNTSTEWIDFQPSFSAVTLISNAGVSNGLKIQHMNWILTENQTINGDLELLGSTLDLAGKVLTVTGNLIHSNGTLKINNGSLIVKGDYRSQTVSTDESGNATYSYSTGRLDMRTANDYMLVEGDFIIDYHTSHNGLLTAGVLELKGNFEQRATNSGSISDNSNFATSGTHKVLLSGSSLQTVTFQTPASSYSHFNVLELTNTSTAGIEFTTNTFITKLFYHHNKAFTALATLNTVDYDGDGLVDAEDLEPINAVAHIDSDNDGIPDYWELLNGLDSNNAADALLDLDNDGVTNLAKFNTHLNPSINKAAIAIQPILQLLSNRKKVFPRMPAYLMPHAQ